MKRVALKRRTPLKRGSIPLRSSTEIAPISRKRLKDNAKRTRVVAAMRLAAAGRCARCGRKDQPVYGHERLARAQGGSILAPDCLLCNECNGWCEDNPQVAAWTGWKVSLKWPHNPALEIGQALDLDGNTIVFEVAR